MPQRDGVDWCLSISTAAAPASGVAGSLQPPCVRLQLLLYGPKQTCLTVWCIEPSVVAQHAPPAAIGSSWCATVTRVCMVRTA
jgi:hypothetical protein